MRSQEIQRLIQQIARLPGLGPRSGRRIALHLLKKPKELMVPFITALQTAFEKVSICTRCFNLDTMSPCSLCQDPKRDTSQICVVEDVTDLWALERTHVFRGHYHVLGGVLSAINGVGPRQLSFEALFRRVALPETQEVVLGLNATLDSQTTTHYIIDCLKPYNKKISRLAYGIPLGGELDYLDDGTLTTAFKSRQTV